MPAALTIWLAAPRMETDSLFALPAVSVRSPAAVIVCSPPDVTLMVPPPSARLPVALSVCVPVVVDTETV